jgi:hypothetical protein
MKFKIGPLKDNIYNFMRELGYHFISLSKGEYNFIRPVGGDAFPRFDVYMVKDGAEFEISLHIDQKRTIYRGSAAHSGEYEGELLEKEAERIKKKI